MIFEHTHYRGFLRAVLSERLKKNPRYSLRAMAKQLGIQSSQLSEVLNGKANISIPNARRIALKLDLTKNEAEYFCLWVELETERDPLVREGLVSRMKDLNPEGRKVSDLSVDLFRQISDWQHSAILELVNLKNFELAPDSISKKLGISKLEAQVSLDRLERLELLARDAQGKWYRPDNDIRFTAGNDKTALYAFYRQMFKKVSESLNTQKPGSERISGFQTIPLSKEALPEIDQAVDRFYEEIIRIARKYPNKDSVYNLMVHFINLTHEKKDERL